MTVPLIGRSISLDGGEAGGSGWRVRTRVFQHRELNYSTSPPPPPPPPPTKPPRR